jgi:hypothetical protein
MQLYKGKAKNMWLDLYLLKKIHGDIKITEMK